MLIIWLALRWTGMACFPVSIQAWRKENGAMPGLWPSNLGLYCWYNFKIPRCFSHTDENLRCIMHAAKLLFSATQQPTSRLTTQETTTVTSPTVDSSLNDLLPQQNKMGARHHLHTSKLPMLPTPPWNNTNRLTELSVEDNNYVISSCVVALWTERKAFLVPI